MIYAVIAIAVLAIVVTHIMWRKDVEKFNLKMNEKDRYIEYEIQRRKDCDDRFYDLATNTRILSLECTNDSLRKAINALTSDGDTSIFVHNGGIYYPNKFVERNERGKTKELEVEFERIGDTHD